MAGLQFEDIKAAQMANAPVYGQQGQVVNADVANTYPGYTPPSPGGVSSSSSSFGSYTNGINTGINTMQGQSGSLADLLKLFDPAKYTTPDDSSLNKIYEDRRTQLDQQRQDELARYNADYSTSKTQIEQNQSKDLAPIDARLNLINSAESGPNAFLAQQLTQQKDKLVQSYKTELDALYNNRENAIASARSAYNDADYKVAALEQQNAKEAQDQIYQRQKDFSNLYLNIVQEQRAQQTQQLQQQQQQIKFNSDNGINAPFYQKPGSSIVYNSQTGQPMSYQEYVSAGGVGKPGAAFPDVQLIQPQADYGSQYKEWQGYVAQGGKLSYPEYQNMDANRKRSVTNVSDPAAEFNLRVKQAPSQVANLKAQGYGWDQIAKYFTSLNIDPGNSEIDDALHRAFQSQADYEKWKALQ